MPFGIRPSNVRVCHSTTRAFIGEAAYRAVGRRGDRRGLASRDSNWETVNGAATLASALSTSAFLTLTHAPARNRDLDRAELRHENEFLVMCV